MSYCHTSKFDKAKPQRATDSDTEPLDPLLLDELLVCCGENMQANINEDSPSTKYDEQLACVVEENTQKELVQDDKDKDIYERIEEFMDKEELYIVSSSPVRKSVLLRSSLRSLNKMASFTTLSSTTKTSCQRSDSFSEKDELKSLPKILARRTISSETSISIKKSNKENLGYAMMSILNCKSHSMTWVELRALVIFTSGKMKDVL